MPGSPHCPSCPRLAPQPAALCPPLPCPPPQILIGLAVLTFGQDLPDGNYAALRKAGKKDKAKTNMELFAAIKNYR